MSDFDEVIRRLDKFEANQEDFAQQLNRIEENQIRSAFDAHIVVGLGIILSSVGLATVIPAVGLVAYITGVSIIYLKIFGWNRKRVSAA